MNAVEKDQSVAYYDERVRGMTVYVLPGHHYAQASGDNSISTLLGSCVAVCIKDRDLPIGGLNHFLLPGSEGDPSQQSARYGVYAMEILINSLIKMGARKSNMEAQIFGGARVIATSGRESVGQKNCEFVRDYLGSEQIRIRSADVGGDRARRIYFFPATGRVQVLNVSQQDNTEVNRNETRISRQPSHMFKSGSVELF